MFRIAVAAIAVIALIAAFTGVMYLRFWADETNRVLVHTQTGSEVVVAVRDIPAATKIEADMVSTRTLPDAEVARDAFTDTAKVIGQVTKFELSAGEQVTSLKVETPNVGCIVCPINQLAVTLNIAPLTREGQRVLPGDRIDILAENDGAGTARKLLENVQVIATREREQSPAPEKEQNFVVLAIEPQQAQVLLSAQERTRDFQLSFPPWSAPVGLPTSH